MMSFSFLNPFSKKEDPSQRILSNGRTVEQVTNRIAEIDRFLTRSLHYLETEKLIAERKTLEMALNGDTPPEDTEEKNIPSGGIGRFDVYNDPATSTVNDRKDSSGGTDPDASFR